MKRAAALACAALAGACAPTGGQMSDWERNNRDLLAPSQRVEVAITPPAYPRDQNLVEFYQSPVATMRYFVDTASVQALHKQGEVRYTLVARSPSGAKNVSYEAMRCSGTYRVIATGNNDGSWNTRAGEWRDIVRRADLEAQSTLKRQFFCPHNDPIQSSAEGIDALRRGAHPLVYVEQNNRGR